MVSLFSRVWKHKLLFVMRLTFSICLFCVLQSFAIGTFSQNARLSINQKNISVESALQLIEDKTDFYFMYSALVVDVRRTVNIEVTNKLVPEILDDIFKGTDIGYKIDGRLIALSKNGEATPAVQQQKSVSGKVTDSSGFPLPGVSIVVKGTSNGIIADVNGAYTLANVPAKAILQFSFVGMKTQEIVVANKTIINVTLVDEAVSLDEVVAVGYGIQKKATTTGSISSVKGEKMLQSPTSNLSNSFAGRFAGVTTVSSSGEPGNDGTTIRIRGANTTGNQSALTVIDGIADRNLNSIDANDIESVTILKDASAAIYGARGANGVILVTTKRGKIGKPKITFNLNQGATQATVLPKMANSVQYATMVNEINSYYGNPATFSPSDIAQFGNGTDPWGHPNTNWYKSVIKPWTNQSSQNMTISGGNENTKFNVSLGARNQDAIYKRSSTGYSQYNFRSNIDTKITNNVNVAFDVAGREEIRNNLAPVNSGVVDEFNSAVGAGDIFEYLLRGKPTMNAFWPNGLPGPDIENGMNAAVVATDVAGYDKDVLDVFESNLKVKINIPWVKGLSVTGNVAVDAQFDSRKVWRKPWYLYNWDGKTLDTSTNLPLLVESQKGPATANLKEASQKLRTITTNALINYDHQFGVHSLGVLAGYERSSSSVRRLSAYRTNYQSTILDQIFAGGNVGSTNYGDEGSSLAGYWSPYARVSYFGRINYSYDEKYLLEFVCRYDGSTIFAPGHQFGFFPGFSAGWRISEEEFWKDNLPFINYFKIRGSYGTTGSDRILNYQYLANYGYTRAQSSSALLAAYILGDQLLQNPLLQQTVVPNPDVTWETAVQKNIGFESQLLNNKLGVEFDYFSYKRSDILLQRNGTVPGSTGITTQLPDMNMGKTSNRGFEVVLSYNDKIKDLIYNISLNGSYSKSKVDYIDEVIKDIPSYQIITGKSIPNNIRQPYYDLYYQAIGIYKDQAQIDATPHWAGARPGDIIFEDVNNDKKIDDNDKVRNEYSNIPRFTGGINFDLKYKQFDLSLLFQGAAGAKQYYLPYSGLLGNFPKDFADNRWTASNTNASYPRAFNLSEYWYLQRNTFFLHNTDYLRLRNLVIGYTAPAKINKLIRAESIRFYVSANNLLTFTKFKNFDPEMNNERGRGYPVQRVINGGITLTF